MLSNTHEGKESFHRRCAGLRFSFLRRAAAMCSASGRGSLPRHVAALIGYVNACEGPSRLQGTNVKISTLGRLMTLVGETRSAIELEANPKLGHGWSRECHAAVPSVAMYMAQCKGQKCWIMRLVKSVYMLLAYGARRLRLYKLRCTKRRTDSRE